MAESYRPYLLEIRGILAISDFHVGSGARLSISTDAPILRDVEGRPYVPASSLRGVLRAHLEREAPLLTTNSEALVASLFGETPPKDSEKKSRAGRLRVFDTFYKEKASEQTEIRDHVKISTKYGGAETGAKFDQEVAYGARLTFRLSYEGAAAKDAELVLLKEAIRALKAEDLSCGAKGGLGYGRMRLEDVEYAEFDRTKLESLSSWLNGRLGEPVAYGSEFAGPTPAVGNEPLEVDRSALKLEPFCCLRMSLQICFEGPVLVHAPIPPITDHKRGLDARKRGDDVEKGLSTADSAFVQTGEGRRYYLPAASLRGVLRHQAERIAMTLLGSTDAVSKLFGEVEEETARKGLIEVGSGELLEPGKPVYLDHVAIDRITGFAADKRKFATCGLQSPVFKTIIRMRFRAREMHLLALAGFVLRDLMDGMLWCGGGTSRGYGFIKSATVTESSLDWTPAEGVPTDFLPEVERKMSDGRCRIAKSGEILFASWLWREAEQAWNKALPATEGGSVK